MNALLGHEAAPGGLPSVPEDAIGELRQATLTVGRAGAAALDAVLAQVRADGACAAEARRAELAALEGRLLEHVELSLAPVLAELQALRAATSTPRARWWRRA